MFYYPIIWYNNKIISLHFNCQDEASVSVLPPYFIIALPDDGHIIGRNM